MSRLLNCRACWLVVVPLLLASLIGPAFWAPSNLKSVLSAIAIEGIMCVGMTIVMVAGGFDLSIGSVMALAGVIVVGADLTLMDISRASVLGIPATGILLLALTAIGHIMLTRFRVGREIHALGGNEAAARSSGVATVRLKILCYTLCSLCAGLAGILLAGQLNTGSPIIGEQAALNVITAVLLGGTSLKGGVGTTWGSLAGLLSVGILENAMRILDVPAYWQRILQGVLLLGIIIVDRVTAHRRARGGPLERAAG